MAGTHSDSSKRTGGALWALLILVGIGCGMLFAIKPELFPLGSPRLVRSVVIEPEEAARNGAQWRVVTQWQGAGEAQSEALQLVEFKNVPGWEAPSPIVLKNGEFNAELKGQYQPANYSEEIILELEGATTMSNRLAPELAQYYLTHLGANEVRRLPGKDGDDISVQGIFYSSREIRTIRIKGGGTSWGFSALRNGVCDIAMAANRPSPEEAALFPENILSPEAEHQIGMDAVAIVVHKDNPVQSLTASDIGKIFRGEITSWDQVGGSSNPIKVFALRDSFGARHLVRQVFMGGKAYAAAVRDVDVHSMMSDFVSEDAHAIGFCSIAFANQCRVMPVGGDAGSEAVAPTPESVRSHTYPAFRDLYLYQLSKSKNVYARDVIRMAQSASGQELVARYGFVSMKSIAGGPGNGIQGSGAGVVDSDAGSLMSQRLAGTGSLPPLDQVGHEVVSEAARRKVLEPYWEAISGATRLPLVLWFEFGSTRLDKQSEVAFEEMIKLLKSPEHAGKKAILVGFSDSAGSYASNLAISRQRTEVVAKRMRNSGIDNVMVLAVGEEEAMEPNKTRSGRERNRRIQVWIK